MTNEERREYLLRMIELHAAGEIINFDAEAAAFQPGAILRRVLRDGRPIVLYPQIYNFKVVISRDVFDDGWYDGW